MEIRHSTLNDISVIMEIYAHARAFMVEHGNPRQWAANGWPLQSTIEEDIKKNQSYVCIENNQVLGTFCFFQGYQIDPTYLNIEQGNWSKDEAYGVVHRIASNGTKGVGTFCISWAFKKAGYIRIDTHPDNVVMQNLLGKLGFRKCGIIHVTQDNDPRYAYDK